MFKWLSKTNASSSSAKLEWRSDASIFALIVANLDDKGCLSLQGKKHLDSLMQDPSLPLSAGLADELFANTKRDLAPNLIQELQENLLQFLLSGEKQFEYKFYQNLVQTDKITGISPILLGFLETRGYKFSPRLYNLALGLATKSTHKVAVKFGIELLGFCANASALPVLKTLALYDEFGKQVAFALPQLSLNLEKDLIELASKVSGWGKIFAVRQLTELDLSPSTKEWLLLEGYKNDIMHEYLAFICASLGELHLAISKKTLSKDLFNATTELLDALITETSPADTIDAYPFTKEVFSNYVRQCDIQDLDISTFVILHKMKEYLEAELQLGAEMDACWSDERLTNLILDIVSVLSKNDWHGLTLVGLGSADKNQYWNAKQAASKLGIDIWEFAWKKLQENPLHHFNWYDVLKNAKSEKSDTIIQYAIDHLPLEILGSGPDLSTGFGDQYSLHTSLEFVVDYLFDFPGKGTLLLLAALKSPVVSVRNVALNTLACWGREKWSPSIVEALTELVHLEPNSKTKLEIEILLASNEK